ncbi:uncharacterized protein LOC115801220 [Archocentrus centrarchus]|uniref:uncharacterized protein LOC115801220 n=1 Tax=Archocentrus centrarchus TaxID=63155 RepID=UPI0011EA2D1B|nr:uncharacterized protein LOC115801220 [Archocentrus centrarchus]
MVVMFRLHQAALLFTQLLVMRIIFAGPAKEDHKVMLVSRGDSVMLTCNTSTKNASVISWTKGRSVFKYSISLNRTSSNFPFHRLKINHELPSKLIIFSAQPEDEGLYRCNITHRKGINSITWNLTVSEILKENISLKDFLYILPPAIGFLLWGIMAAVLLCSKNWTMTPNNDPDKDRTLSCVEYHVQLGRELTPQQSHSLAAYMTSNSLRGSASGGLTRRQCR